MEAYVTIACVNLINLHAKFPASHVTVKRQMISVNTLSRPTLRSIIENELSFSCNYCFNVKSFFLLPAIASCLMKKFIRDFRLFRNNVTKTAVFPSTITANRIHNTVNCSVCNSRKQKKTTITKA